MNSSNVAAVAEGEETMGLFLAGSLISQGYSLSHGGLELTRKCCHLFRMRLKTAHTAEL